MIGSFSVVFLFLIVASSMVVVYENGHIVITPLLEGRLHHV